MESQLQELILLVTYLPAGVSVEAFEGGLNDLMFGIMGQIQPSHDIRPPH